MKNVLFALALALASPNAEASNSFLTRDINGKVVNLDNYKDKIVMINFWATWCAPCKVEMPQLQKLKEKYGDRLVIVSVSVDEARDKSKIKPLIRRGGYDFVVVHDDDRSIMSFYNPSMDLPYNVINGYGGNIVWQGAGYSPGKEKVFEKIIDSIIK
tara:strand:+ start:388 stop:858 length:471 start_codon:yes stop_codon:yes gene_type:complete